MDVALSGSRCFEGEDVTITATVRGPGGRRWTRSPRAGPRATGQPGSGAPAAQTFLQPGLTAAQWVIRPAAGAGTRRARSG